MIEKKIEGGDTLSPSLYFSKRFTSPLFLDQIPFPAPVSSCPGSPLRSPGRVMHGNPIRQFFPYLWLAGLLPTVSMVLTLRGNGSLLPPQWLAMGNAASSHPLCGPARFSIFILPGFPHPPIKISTARNSPLHLSDSSQFLIPPSVSSVSLPPIHREAWGNMQGHNQNAWDISKRFTSVSSVSISRGGIDKRPSE